MQRRHFLAAGALACSAAAAPKYSYRLRYAPHVTDRDVDYHRQLEVFAEQGFRAFEFNALPKQSDAAITALAKTKERLGLAMGVFVINRGGWKPSALVDRKFHGDFLADVKRAVERQTGHVPMVATCLVYRPLCFRTSTLNRIVDALAYKVLLVLSGAFLVGVFFVRNSPVVRLRSGARVCVSCCAE